MAPCLVSLKHQSGAKGSQNKTASAAQGATDIDYQGASMGSSPQNRKGTEWPHITR